MTIIEYEERTYGVDFIPNDNSHANFVFAMRMSRSFPLYNFTTTTEVFLEDCLETLEYDCIAMRVSEWDERVHVLFETIEPDEYFYACFSRRSWRHSLRMMTKAKSVRWKECGF